MIEKYKNKLQLIGLACMSLSISINEIFFWDADSYIDLMTKVNSTKDEFNMAQDDVFTILGYDLIITTPLDYEKVYVGKLTSSQIAIWKTLVVYFCLSNVIYHKYLARDIGAMCYELAKYGELRSLKFVKDSSSIIPMLQRGMLDSFPDKNIYLKDAYLLLKKPKLGLGDPMDVLKF